MLVSLRAGQGAPLHWNLQSPFVALCHYRQRSASEGAMPYPYLVIISILALLDNIKPLYPVSKWLRSRVLVKETIVIDFRDLLKAILVPYLLISQSLYRMHGRRGTGLLPECRRDVCNIPELWQSQRRYRWGMVQVGRMITVSG